MGNCSSHALLTKYHCQNIFLHIQYILRRHSDVHKGRIRVLPDSCYTVNNFYSYCHYCRVFVMCKVSPSLNSPAWSDTLRATKQIDEQKNDVLPQENSMVLYAWRRCFPHHRIEYNYFYQRSVTVSTMVRFGAYAGALEMPIYGFSHYTASTHISQIDMVAPIASHHLFHCDSRRIDASDQNSTTSGVEVYVPAPYPELQSNTLETINTKKYRKKLWNFISDALMHHLIKGI